VHLGPQAPERLENDNETMHQHACGEYILEQLQKGSIKGGETEWHMTHGTDPDLLEHPTNAYRKSTENPSKIDRTPIEKVSNIC